MSTPPAAGRPSIPPPPQLGDYEIIAEIAKGGMGTVYLARRAGEAGFQRLFAIKSMHPHLAEDLAFVDMLRDEARIAARLHHHNVVPVVDLGTQDGVPYVVMEYVDGCSLSALLSRNKQQRPPELLVPIFIDALEGLHAAHTMRDDDGNPLHLVHRDVTPHNIMIGADGTARIIDFGIAKAEARVTSTRPGILKGKFAYMAPEQLSDEGDNADLRADIFAAGAALWTALTARPLFRADTDGATLHNVMHKPVLAPSKVGLEPPPEYDEICLRALCRNPAERYASAREMAEALRAACKNMGSRAAVADWVTSSFHAELESRRAAIRSAAQLSQRSSSASVPALPALAGPPSITGESWRAAGEPGTPTPSARPGSLAPHAEATHPAATAPRSSKLWLVAIPVLLLAAGAAVVVALHPGAATKPSASAPSSAPALALSAPVAAPSAEPEPSALPPAESASATNAAAPVRDVTSLPREQTSREQRPAAKSKADTAKSADKPAPKPAETAAPPPTSKPSDINFEKNPYLK